MMSSCVIQRAISTPAPFDGPGREDAPAHAAGGDPLLADVQLLLVTHDALGAVDLVVHVVARTVDVVVDIVTRPVDIVVDIGTHAVRVVVDVGDAAVVDAEAQLRSALTDH